jgi:hypothetical protein
MLDTDDRQLHDSGGTGPRAVLSSPPRCATPQHLGIAFHLISTTVAAWSDTKVLSYHRPIVFVSGLWFYRLTAADPIAYTQPELFREDPAVTPVGRREENLP